MKAKLPFTLFLLSTCSLFSQKTLTEYWSNGLLKQSLVMRGSDTLKIESYQENGFPAYKAWGRDSAYQYDLLGNLREKHFKFKYAQWSSIQSDENYIYDVSGKLLTHSISDSAKGFIKYSYQNNSLKSTWQSFSLNDSISQIVEKDAKGRLLQRGIHTYVKRSTNVTKDTFFFQNAKIQVISWANRQKYPPENLFLKIYDEAGNVLVESSNERTLKLEKDNSECLYGFKNQKNEWAIPPQYDVIKPLNIDLFVAYKPNEAAILNDKGEKILTQDWEYLDVMKTNSCGVMRASRNREEIDHWRNEALQDYQLKKDRMQSLLFKFRKKGKYGVTDINGNLILEPIYDNIRDYFNDNYEVQIGKKWGVVNGKGEVLVQPNFYKITFTDLPNVFVINDTFKTKHNWTGERYGLINDKSEYLLPLKYSQISQIDTLSFWAIISEDYSREEHIYTIGKGELFNDSFRISFNHNNPNVVLVSKKDSESFKYGISNLKGEWLFPLIFKEIQYANLKSNLSDSYNNNALILKNEEDKFGLFNLDTQKQILPFEYDQILVDDNYHERVSLAYMINDIHNLETRIFTQENHKWQLRNYLGQLFQKEVFDFVGRYVYEASPNYFNGCNWRVLNDSIGFYNTGSFPNKTEFSQILNLEGRHFFQLKDFDNKNLLFDKKGKLLLPPQYLVKNITPNNAVAYDTLLKKYVIIDTTGKIKTLNTPYDVKGVYEKVLIVEDPKTRLLGVMNEKNQVIIPNSMQAISVSEKNQLLWLKTIIPKLPIEVRSFYTEFDSCVLDDDWMMYNLKGKPLNTYKFSMPIVFEKNVGIGRLTGSGRYGIWRNDGSIVLPPQYDYVLQDTSEGVFYIFKRWADSSFAVGYCDYSGKIIKEPRFDKMSRFFGDYALVQTNAQRGILRKNGEWLCPPFDGNILNFKGSILDSFNRVNKINLPENSYWGKYVFNDYQQKTPFTLPFLYNIEIDFERKLEKLTDSSRNALTNFMLFKTIDALALQPWTDFNLRITDSIHKTSDFKNILLSKGNSDIEFRIRHRNLERFERYKINYGPLSVDEMLINGNFGALIIKEFKSGKYNQGDWKAHNFYQNEQKKWVETNIEDWIELNRDNIIKLNDLLFLKVKALINENLDCSNSNSFFESYKNFYFIQKEGISFFIPRTNGRYGMVRDPYEWHHAPVLITWEELKKVAKKTP
jgi:WG containing repeat